MDDLDVEALLEGALKNKGKVLEEEKESKDRKRSRDRDDHDREKRHRRRHSRSKSRERDGHRHSSDRDRRGGRYSDQKEREREKEKERRRRDDERKRQREKEALLTPAEREAIEIERDGRTIFACNLPLKADEDDIAAFFSKAGKVRDIRLITDRNSRKSKGFAYVEFFDKDTVPAGLALGGTQMMGQTIQVNQTEAEKNRMAQAHQMTSTPVGPSRIYVGGLHVNTNEETLRKTFSRYGDVTHVNIHYDPETRRSKGFGFIQFRKSEEAKRAVQQGNKMELDGKTIKVNFVNESKTVGSLGDLDDEEGKLTLNAQSRVLLMEKLQRSEMNTRNQEAAKSRMLPPFRPPILPTTTLLLTNMFDPDEETEPNWDKEIEEDTKEECTKFGPVVHIFVDKHSKGQVYMKFGTIPGAQNAINALNNRWFAGRMITAEYYPEQQYYARFPEARGK